jgi:hypothetical protein
MVEGRAVLMFERAEVARVAILGNFGVGREFRVGFRLEPQARQNEGSLSYLNLPRKLLLCSEKQQVHYQLLADQLLGVLRCEPKRPSVSAYQYIQQICTDEATACMQDRTRDAVEV